MSDKTKILFVCLGNICRSPAAEGIFKHFVNEKGLSDKFFIDSAGTYGGHAGSKADSRMRSAASKRNYDLTSRSRKIKSDDFEEFDMILVMDDMNYENVHRLAPNRECYDRIYRMRDFCRETKVSHVPDPYYEGHEGFEIVLNILEDGCKNLLDNILNDKL
ncbi:MAG: low molecular weight protein-tyrosine-phosphatase [Rikenellaceae bacterium]